MKVKLLGTLLTYIPAQVNSLNSIEITTTNAMSGGREDNSLHAQLNHLNACLSFFLVTLRYSYYQYVLIPTSITVKV